jgi:hypothetical protein
MEIPVLLNDGTRPSAKLGIGGLTLWQDYALTKGGKATCESRPCCAVNPIAKQFQNFPATMRAMPVKCRRHDSS